VFGIPLVMRGFMGMFHPGAIPTDILLHPVARAAWLGFLATALNLVPVWQLDGGHILYSLTDRFHERISLFASLTLIGMGLYLRAPWFWAIWGFVMLVLSLRFKHPAPIDRWERLDASRKLLAVVALAIFALCFMLVPILT
jgi:membrane-associated protease RseP (regulator of RpoE activity)